MPTAINITSSTLPMYTSGSFSLANSCGLSPTFIGGSSLTLISTTEVSQLCPAQLPQSECSGGTLPGMEAYLYQVQVTLPDCDCWTFSYTLCCRNSAITNLATPGSNYSTIQSTLCNATGPSCNNGPNFTAQPIPYICNNIPFCYDYGVVEPDGHTLSYAFTPALNSGNPSAYSGGYSATQPIPGITIDPLTGQICFTPTINGNFVVTIMVTETDGSGNVIGTYMQDIQFVIQNCPNTPPTAPNSITSTSGSGSVTGASSIQLCENDNFCTDVIFTDVDVSNLITLTSNVTSVLPGATITITNGNPANATICWTENQGGPAFYSFTVTAEDDACPIPGLNSFTIDVTVLGPTDPACFTCTLVGSLSSQTNVGCNGGSDGSITVNASLGVPNYQYSIDGGTTWQGSPSFNGLTAGNYTITIEDASLCQDIVNVTITEPTPVTISLHGTSPVLCNGGSTGTINTTGNGGTPSYQYSVDGGTTWQSSGIFSGQSAGNYIILIEDANGCQSSITATVTEPSALTGSVSSTTDATCGMANGSYTISGSNGTPGYQYSNDGGVTWQASGSFTGILAGAYTVSIQDLNGCITTVNVSINDLSGLTASINSQTDVTCNGGNDGSVTIIASGSTAPYQYSIDGGTTWQSSGTFNGLNAGSYTIIAEDANSCQFPVSITITEPTSVIGSLDATNDVSCNGGSDGDLTVSATGGISPYQYSIDGGTTWQSSGNFTSLNAGGYTVTIQDANGCQTTVNATINEPTVLTGNTVNTVDVNCNAGNDGSFTTNGAGGTSPYQYSIDGGTTWQGSSTFSNLSAGIYTLTIEDAAGCQTTVTVTINEPSPVTGSIVSTTDATCGFANGAFEVLGSGGTNPYQYSVDGGITWQSSGLFSGYTAGSYSVTIIDVNNCQTIVTVIINDLSGLTASISSQTDVTCNAGNDGSVTIIASGSSAPYQYSIDGGITWQSSGTFNGLNAGSYTIISEDANNCQFPVSVTIIEPTLLIGSFNASTDVTCNGGADGDITVSASGGTIPYQFSIDGGTTWQNSGFFSGLSAGSYTITIEDILGCQTTLNTTVNEPTIVNGAIANTNDVSCNGGNDGSLTVIGSGGISPYQYSIDGGITWQSSGTFGTLSAGNHIVTVEDLNGCQTTITVTINEPASVIATATTVSNATGAGLCDGITTVNVTGGTLPYTYLWDDPLGQTTQSANSLCAGTWCVIVTDAMGCVDTSCTTVIEPGMINIISTQINIDCNGNCNGSIDISVNGGVIPYTYAWSGPNGFTSTIEDPTGLCAGVYDLVLTDFNSITSTHSLTISEPTVMSASVIGTTNALCNSSCDGTADISISGGSAPYLFAWSGPNGFTANTEDINGLCAGNYSVIITDDSLCTTSLNISINEPSIIVLNTTFNSSNCGQADGSVGVTAIGGTVLSNYSYIWSLAGITIGTNAIESNLTAGAYDVTVTDDNGCTSTTTETITDIGGGIASTTADIMVSCNGLCDGQATVTMIGGTAPFVYVWGSGTTPTLATTGGLCAGSNSITVTDDVGCISAGTVIITEPANVTATTNTIDETCLGDCQGSVTIIGSGGTSPYLYSFDNGVTFGPSNTLSSLCANTYNLAIEDINGCRYSFNIDILPGIPYADATVAGFGPLCEDVSPVTMTTAGTGGVWSGPGVTGNQFNPASVGPGTYTVAYEISTLCGDTGTFDVTVLPLPIVSFIADIYSGCEPLLVNFTSTGDPTVLCYWDFGDGGVSSDCGSTSYTYINPGIFDVTLTVVDANDCQNTLTEPAFIEVYTVPIADFTFGPQPTTILDPTIYFNDQSINAVQWNWDFSSLDSSTLQNPSYNFDNFGSFEVELIATSIEGCTDTAINTIYIEDEFLVYVPNAFSADGNGVNDIFLPITNGIDPFNYVLYIFNRWGELIFEAHHPDQGWDGSFKGRKSEQGVYVYKIIAYNKVDGEMHNFIGHFTLLK